MKKSGTERRRIRPEGLLALGEAKLARLLAEQLGSLPSHRQTQWIRQHLRAVALGCLRLVGGRGRVGRLIC